MHKGLALSQSLLRMKHLKSCLPEESLLDTTILLISISFIKIELYFNEICILQLQWHQIL